MTKLKVKKGDKVRIISGKDKGRDGKVLFVDIKKNRVLVEGVNMITKHQKANATSKTGGIVRKEAPIDASNVMYLHNGVPTRLGYKLEEIIDENGKKEFIKHRIAKSTGDIIE